MDITDHADWLVDLSQIGLLLKHVKDLLENFHALLLGDGALSAHKLLEMAPVRETILLLEENFISKGFVDKRRAVGLSESAILARIG
jgi:hypothetical protein